MNNSLACNLFGSFWNEKPWITLVKTNRFRSQLFLLLFTPDFHHNRNMCCVFMFRFLVWSCFCPHLVVGSLVSCYPSLICAIKPFMFPCVAVYHICSATLSIVNPSLSFIDRPCFCIMNYPSVWPSFIMNYLSVLTPSLGGIPQSVLIKSRFIWNSLPLFSLTVHSRLSVFHE